MSRKQYFVERIISNLREAEVLLAQGRTVGGLKMDQAQRLKELERENGTSHNRDFERTAGGPGGGMQHPASRHALDRQIVKMGPVCFAPAA